MRYQAKVNELKEFRKENQKKMGEIEKALQFYSQVEDEEFQKFFQEEVKRIGWLQ